MFLTVERRMPLQEIESRGNVMALVILNFQREQLAFARQRCLAQTCSPSMVMRFLADFQTDEDLRDCRKACKFFDVMDMI